MIDHNLNIASLIGSRICHDLISPVGAVSNGLELLEMSGISATPELALVNSSAADASARIKVFRLAFGAANDDQQVGHDEFLGILRAHYSDGRITVAFPGPTNIPRHLAQQLILAVLCAEQSLPYGGNITIQRQGRDCKVTAVGEKVKPRPELWACLQHGENQGEIRPSDVQHLLLHDLLNAQGRSCAIDATDTQITMKF